MEATREGVVEKVAARRADAPAKRTHQSRDLAPQMEVMR